MAKETITALMAAPGMYPVVTELYKENDFIQRAVSIGAGSLCTVEVLQLGSAVLLCGEEAGIYGAPGNRWVGKRAVSGVFYIVGYEAGKIVSLSQDNIDWYKDMFWEPDDISDTEAVETYLDHIFI